MNSNSNRFSTAVLLLIAAMTLLAGCPEDPTTQMARQIQSQGTPPGGAPVSAPDATGATPAAAGQLGAPADAGHVPGGAPGQAMAAEPAEEQGPVVTVTDIEITPPAPRWEDKGRYDMSFKVATEPPVDEAVWRITAVDAEGNIVGDQEQLLILLHSRPKPLKIDSFYCLAKPVNIKLELARNEDGSLKKAIKAGEGGEGGEGAGGDNGGGVAPPQGPGLGGGGAGGGGGVAPPQGPGLGGGAGGGGGDTGGDDGDE